MVEDVTQQFTQDSQTDSQAEQGQDNQDVLDLDNKEELDSLIKDTTGGAYFQPEDGKKYKITLNSPKVEAVVKSFTKTDKDTGELYEDQQNKWVFNVHVKDRDGNEVDKYWEVGKKTANQIAKLLKERDTPVTETTFYLEREGSGINTSYKVYIPDF